MSDGTEPGLTGAGSEPIEEPGQYTDEDLGRLDELIAEADRRIEKSKAAEAKPTWRRLLHV